MDSAQPKMAGPRTLDSHSLVVVNLWRFLLLADISLSYKNILKGEIILATIPFIRPSVFSCYNGY